jgi:hypothetical protein
MTRSEPTIPETAVVFFFQISLVRRIQRGSLMCEGFGLFDQCIGTVVFGRGLLFWLWPVVHHHVSVST